MDSGYSLVFFAMAWLVAVASPGPNFFLIAATSVTQPRPVALLTALGIAVASGLWGVLGYLGVATLPSDYPHVQKLLSLLGGGYFLWVGYKFLLISWRIKLEPLVVEAPIKMPLRAMWAGFISNTANPKTAVFVVSLFAFFQTVLDNDYGYFSIAIMMAVSLVWHAMIASIFSSKAMVMRYQQKQHWLNRIASTVFIGYGIYFCLTAI